MKSTRNLDDLARQMGPRAYIASPVRPSLSVVVPARNERGNIGSLLNRLPVIEGTATELIFVEGNSEDRTWEEIVERVAHYDGPWKMKTLRQVRRGKSDAVRAGIEESEGEIVAILDADLSMPPESLPQFYEAYTSGYGDFIMGNRFVEPMEPGAMRLMNRWGNRGFAVLVSWILDTKVGDCLCGTKLFLRSDYARFRKWREDFGDLDPFGDFELLFAAVELGLRVVEIPIRYRARTYGRPNIRRWRDGARLARMCWRAMWTIKFARVRPAERKGASVV